MVMINRSHLCHRMVGCRIVGDSEKQETIRPKAWSKGTGKRQENETTQNIDICLGNSLRFSTKGLCWGWGDFRVLMPCVTPQGLLWVMVVAS